MNLKNGFTGLVAALLLVTSGPQLLVAAKHHSSSDSAKKKCKKEKRDYVIIGGGTAGLVTGYLLDKDGKDVLILEAGENYDNDPEILNAKPIGALEGGFLNYFFWNTQNQPNPSMPNDTDRHMTGGRAIGGTSTVNDQIYWRGSLNEYALWGGLFADSNYVQKTFAAAETYVGTTQNPAARGNIGPFTVRQSTLAPIGTKMASALQATLAKPAFGSRAIPLVPDFNSVNGPAISPQAQLWIKELTPTTGQRQSTSIVLLGNKASKVKVRDAATVLRIVFNKAKNKAVAVDYLHKNKVKRVWARKKIILSSGARSCAVLMKSGYGPKNLLEDNNIKVVYDNPNVGIKLRNHLFVTPQFSCPTADNDQIARPLGTPLNKDLAFMASVPAPSDPANGQSLEYTVINAAPGVGVMAIILNNPESSGTVKIDTNDPLHELIVDLPALSNPADLQKMVEAVQIYQDMINSTPGYGFITSIPTTTAGIETYVKTSGRSIHHYTGTCSIGYVVDEHLNVIGIKNLMVADASIEQPSIQGHTYASALLIGAAAYSEITGNLDVDFN
ncbi:MAG: GMC family oxidoreductase [Chlamydiales bacterium]|nr:GMC family oxidoreductase [Chlamydiales bacterium]